MQLVLTEDLNGEANQIVVYEGPSLDAMEEALELYITENLTARQIKYVRRWWIKARENAENGLEPELYYPGDVGTDLLKVLQTVGS